MNEKLEVYEKMVKDIQWDIEYHAEKARVAKLKLQIMIEKKQELLTSEKVES